MELDETTAEVDALLEQMGSQNESGNDGHASKRKELRRQIASTVAKGIVKKKLWVMMALQVVLLRVAAAVVSTAMCMAMS